MFITKNMMQKNVYLSIHNKYIIYCISVIDLQTDFTYR